jgi:hypothetical protein
LHFTQIEVSEWVPLLSSNAGKVEEKEIPAGERIVEAKYTNAAFKYKLHGGVCKMADDSAMSGKTLKADKASLSLCSSACDADNNCKAWELEM